MDATALSTTQLLDSTGFLSQGLYLNSVLTSEIQPCHISGSCSHWFLHCGSSLVV